MDYEKAYKRLVSQITILSISENELLAKTETKEQPKENSDTAVCYGEKQRPAQSGITIN